MTIFYPMRRRIPAATLPCTSRKHSRIQDRIPSLNRKGWGPPFPVWMNCDRAREKDLPQSFLLIFGIGGVA